MKQTARWITLMLLSFTLSACRCPFGMLCVFDVDPEHGGFLDCFRLDREPPVNEGDAACNLQFDDQFPGNFHLDPERNMVADVVPVSMDSERVAKLPVSRCLWTARSRFGNGDRLGLFWEAFINVSVEGRAESISACRFDPAFNRISSAIAQELSVVNPFAGQCLKTGALLYTNHQEPPPIGQMRSSCDIDSYVMTLRERRVSAQFEDPFGACQTSGLASYSHHVPLEADRHLSGLFATRDGVSACPGLAGDRLVSVIPALDARFEVAGPNPGGTKELLPVVKVVTDQRSISRPLARVGSSDRLRWSTNVLIDEGPGRQRWNENFSENVRVDQVRVFFQPEPGQRQYLSLDGAVLQVWDPDNPAPGAAATCFGQGESIDLLACGLDATPTYRVANLARNDLTTLTNPLVWEIQLPELQQSSHFLEFDLVSTYQTRESAILLNPFFVDFGGVLAGTPRQRLIQVENVGFGHFTIDAVAIDPGYGDAQAFSAERLDDPLMMPYPFYLEPTGAHHQYLTGLQAGHEEIPLFDLREFENHVSLAMADMDAVELEIEGEAVRFSGSTAVAIAAQPSFTGGTQTNQRHYPFSYPIYQTWNLPFTLAPGEQRSIMVTVRPSWSGELRGKLNVTGFPTHAPGSRQTVSLLLEASGLNGPLGFAIPSSLRFPHPSDQAVDRTVAIVSHGHFALYRGDIEVQESDDPAHAGEDQNFVVDASTPSQNNIAPGDSEMIRIRYQPRCFYIVPFGGEHLASLLIDTDVGPVTVQLRGDPAAASAAGECVM